MNPEIDTLAFVELLMNTICVTAILATNGTGLTGNED